MISLGLFKVIAMGIVQGLSEFLPISSSAHLVFTSNLISQVSHTPIQEVSNYDTVLDMMLHIGTLIAVLIFFKNELCKIFNAFINGVKNKDFNNYDAKLGLYIISGTFISIIVALSIKDTAEVLLNRPDVVGLLLMITGFTLYFSEKYSEKIETKDTEITKIPAIVMAIAQGLAALPGISRSGFTIAAGLFSKVNRIACARYSFLLSIPIILGASIVYPLKEISFSELVSYNWVNIIIGTIVSGIVGYVCIKYFLKFLSKYSMKVFAYYCLLVGGLFCILFNFILK